MLKGSYATGRYFCYNFLSEREKEVARLCASADQLGLARE